MRSTELALLSGVASGILTIALWKGLRGSRDQNYAPDLEWLLLRAAALQTHLHHDKTSVTHLLTVMDESGVSKQVTQPPQQPAQDPSLTKKELEDTMKAMLFNQQPGDQEATALERFAQDLTQAARSGKLDPVIGRDEEIRRCIHILSRRTKNNPVLVGESGVGKTAIVEGLAQRIVNRDVPVTLLNTTIMELDIAALTAGCAMPGEFEERFKAVLAEVGATNGRTILFIDDIHNLVPSMGMQGATMLDGGALLKPALSRGTLRCIGASSVDKFKKTIEKDPGLERRFQQVQVDQPSVDDTISILRGLRPRYESYHGVGISEGALMGAAALAARYINGRYLPDKAIDLMDEATAQVKMEMTLKPEALDVVDRKIKRLESEEASLSVKAEGDRTAASCLQDVREQLMELRAQQKVLSAENERDKEKESEAEGAVSRMSGDGFKQLYQLEQELQALHLRADEAEEEEDLAEADRLRAEAGDVQSRLEVVRAEVTGTFKAMSAVVQASKRQVVEGDVAKVISRWTGIPITKLVASEKEKLLHLEDVLHRRIIGQQEAVAAVSEAIQRSRADLVDPNGPIASFMFLGPTGVGKTELAKALAEYLFNSEEAMVRLDMSEYMEKHAVSRLIGAPPGYVGYDEGGLLTDAVRRRPYAVVLFDEIEKAHVDVFNILLQVLDDGRITDAQGRTVSFKNTLIIMTSNLGSQEIFQELSENREEVRERVMEHVRSHFRPEFINRVDEFITFEPLKPDQIKMIVILRSQRLIDRMADKRMRLVLTDGAVEYLAQNGYDPVYGARPVKRALQRELQTLLARALLRSEFEEDDLILVQSGQEGLSLSCVRGGAAPRAVNASSASQESALVPGSNGEASHLANGMCDAMAEEEEEEEQGEGEEEKGAA